MQRISRIQELVKELNIACNAYYDKDNPTLTDKQYDALYDELTALEEETNYISSASPTQKVQGKVLSSLVKVQHTEPMLSADKSKDINDVIKFMGYQECVLSWKLDGLTLVLKYDQGKFLQAITRGGGEYGEDVTHTVRTFSNIPLTIDYKGYLEIRGEGLVEFKEFIRINSELVAKGEEEYSSPRNLAAGSVRQLDSTITKKRNLIFIAFGIVKCDQIFKSKVSQFRFLSGMGFTTVEFVMTNKNDVQDLVELYKTKIEQLEYLTDGLIVEYDNIAYGKAQGFTGHHSKSLYALKHNDDSYETIFRGVKLNTTRTGIVSITGLFDEVDIDGVKVSKASLHNYDVFNALELGVGDVVTVYRANAVIPQIEENLTRSGAYKINMECPSCGGSITIRAPKVANFLFCENVNCPSKLVNRFVHICSKKALNIDGLSEAGIELFIQKGFLENFYDLYNIGQHHSEIIKLEGWGNRSYKKLIDAVDASKQTELYRVIYGIGIPQIGVNGSKNLCKHFNNNVEEIMNASVSELLLVEDFGIITAENVYNYFQNDTNYMLLIMLLGYLDIKKEVKEVKNMEGVLTGHKLYCTGTFASYKKEELKVIIQSLGGEFANGYAKSLDYLVVGKLKGSSKEAKALKDGIAVLSEDEFLEMIGI